MKDDTPISSSNVSQAQILTQNDGVPGSKFEQDPENYTNTQLKRWLKCRGLKLSGKRADLISRVLENTDLENADLENADLANKDLENTDVSQAL